MIELPRRAFLAIATGLPMLAAAPAAADDQQTVYVRTDLVSNTQNLVQPKDPNLQNAWGVANRRAVRCGLQITVMAFPRSMTAME